MKKRLISALAAVLIAVTPGASLRAAEDIKAVETAEAAESAVYSAMLSGEKAENGGYALTVAGEGECTALMVAAVFEKESGRFLSVAQEKITVKAGEPFNHTINVEYNEENQYVKGFFWDAETLCPLAAALDSRTYAATEPPKEEEEEINIPLSAANVWSTDRQDAHNVAAMFDGSKDTYMAGQAQTDAPVYIYAELGGLYELARLDIGFHSSGNERSYAFDVFISTDGENYELALEDKHSPRTSDLPASHALSGKAAYLKIAVYGYDDKNNNWNDNGWIRVNHLALYGKAVNGSRVYTMEEDFEGKKGRLGASVSDSDWFAYALDEEAYTDYTPALGSDLLAEYTEMPGGSTALHIHDNADRETGNGRGSVGAFRKLSVPADEADYTVNFTLLIPADSENINWSGLNLLSQPVSGGADLEPAAALQLRLSSSGGKAVVNVLDSVQYNEGYFRRAFDGEFVLGTPWDVTLKVSPKGKRAEITIDDGYTKETQTLGYNYTDVERVNNQTWSSAYVQYISFNSGAGGKLDMYVDDFSLCAATDKVVGPETIFYEDFESVSSPAAAGIVQHVVQANNNGSDSSIGSNLQATVAESDTFGGHVLKLTDKDSSNGLVVAVPLIVPTNGNKYIIKWRMRDFNPGNYSGFSLSSGTPTGFNDTAHPFAFQLRYNLQDGSDGNGNGIQLFGYGSALMNSGSYGLFAAGGGSRLAKNSEWNVEITVNPMEKNLVFKLEGGGRSISKGWDFAATDADGNTIVDWNDRFLDTLVFHTGAGAVADCIIDDIEVIDTGERENTSGAAVMGIVRLEGVYDTGRYITQNGEDRPTNANDVDPNRTRFAERPGLADVNGVSLESVEKPGWFLYAEETDQEGHSFVLALKKLDGSAQDKAFATFYKEDAPYDSDYHGYQKYYIPIWDTSRRINYSNNDTEFLISKTSADRNDRFYLRSEAVNYVSDNFKGNTLNSQWWTNYPWKVNNPTNDSYNFTALIDHRNVIVENGELFLKATKIDGWPTDLSGETGINYNGSYGKNWIRWAGRVGVVSIQNKVYNKECLIEGSFKQPDSPIGYWNAFWLTGRDSWPPEIDIFEFLSSKYGHTSWNSSIHGEGDKNNLFGTSSKNGINLTSGYHTFTMDWGYNYIKLYVDGQLFQSARNHSTVNYQKNMRLILNTGIGGWEAEPDSTMKWDDGMRVQWIRSFQY